MKLISIMDTTFRDGLQSVYGARVAWEDLAPAVEAASKAGIDHFEFGGGARFQSLYFYLNEDAFKMMDEFRKIVGPKANLQTLSRGINTLALETASSEIINLHAKLFAKHGASTIRNFDALNNADNLIYSAKCINEYGLKHELCVTLMNHPAHTKEFYIQRLRSFLDAGIEFSSLCFKDASGSCAPKLVGEVISAARALLGDSMHIRCHTHESAGLAAATYLAALEAGANGIDLAAGCVSGGTSQLNILTMMHILKGSEFKIDLDEQKIAAYERVLNKCLDKYFLPPESASTNALIISSPMPGGAMSANTQMMRDQGLFDRLPEVIEQMSEVIKLAGAGTSVTPVSQFYFQQALNNVLFGPWVKIAPGFGKMILGYFGATPLAADEKLVKLASEQLNLEPTKTPALEIADNDENKSIEHYKSILKANDIACTDENIFILACCEDKGLAFLQGKAKINIRLKTDEMPKAVANDKFIIKVNDKSYKVSIEPDTNEIKSIITAPKEHKAPKIADENSGDILSASMPGCVYKLSAKVGDEVKKGDEICVLEAMKMEISLEAHKDGKIEEIYVKEQEVIAALAPIAKIV